MTYYVHSADQRLPNKARLGQGTLSRLAEIQLVEKLSVDVIVARCVQHYFDTVTQQQEQITRGIYGRKETEGIEQH